MRPFPSILRQSLRLVLLAFAFAGFGHTTAFAIDGHVWTVIEARGDASVRIGDASPRKVAEGDEVGAGSHLETGADGRLVVANSGTSMTLGPDSRSEIPAGTGEGGRTTILQSLGSLLFKVDKRPTQHFEVRTPYLAAVVKGTTFTVRVDSEATAVHVVEGAVEVAALATGQVQMVRPGFTAIVSSKPGSRLKIEGGGGKAGNDKTQKKQGAGDAPTGDVIDRAARSTAPVLGEAKHLDTMLGETDVDVEATTNGFVKNAAPDPTGTDAAQIADRGAGVPGQSAVNPRKAGGGNPGGGGGNPGGGGGNPGGGGGNPGGGGGGGNGHGTGYGGGHGGGKGKGAGHGKGNS